MNTTGCPPLTARDDFFTMGGPEPGCTLILPLFFTFVTLFAIVLVWVAVRRTQLILKKAQRDPQGKRELGSLQIITLIQSWASGLNAVLIVLIPATYGSGNNVMLALLGFQIFLHNLSSERWFSKLIRLGKRIGGRVFSTLAGQEDDTATMDTYLKTTLMTLRIVFTIQLLLIALFAAFIFPTTKTIFQAGVGLQAFLNIVSISGMIYQYNRCEKSIMATRRAVMEHEASPNPNGGSVGDTNDAMRMVRVKFRRHQALMAFLGVPGALIFLIWSLDLPTFPLNNYFLLVSMAYDSLTNSSMFFSFVGKRRTKNSSTAASSHKSASRGKKNPRVNMDTPASMANPDTYTQGDGSSMVGQSTVVYHQHQDA